jgi:SPP1 gp7 family putative phage head morphogenesis protein
MDGIMAEWVREYGTQKIKQITETTREDIAAIVQAGIKEGKSEREIGKLIRAIATTKSASRAQTIARTETHAASQASANASAQATGIEMQRVWVASNGERTRDTHRAADGQMVGMNDKFTVGGSELRYPGDPNGPAAEVINCRCAVVFEIID